MLFLHTVMQESQHIPALQLCLVAALAAVVYSDCSIPRTYPFAVLRNKVVRENYPVGTSIYYRCLPGYEPIPGTQPAITCLETSEWSEIPQFCQGRHCPFPDIDNGQIENMADLRLGDQITFVCNKGYRLIGQNGARCVLVANRVIWSTEIPHCERISCFHPPIIANGRHSGTNRDNYDYGSAVTYNCESGFSLIGDKTIVCTTDKNGIEGKWSGSAPRCEVVECRRPEISNGKIVSSYQPSYTYGDTVMFGCYRGNILQGENVIKCEANSTWHPAPPVCVPRGCDPPKLTPFAVLKREEKRESYPVGTTLTYHCIPGYEKIPGLNHIIRCLATSEWSKNPPFCQRRQCPFPNIQNGGIAIGSDLLFGGEVTFVCNEGYRLIGQNSARCVFEDGNVVWNTDPPQCERLPCLPPPTIANGSFVSRDGDNFAYRSVVVYRCDAGFSLIGENIIYCTTERNGLTTKWSGPAPECKVVNCNRPEISNGQILFSQQSSYTYGETVKFLCSLQYMLRGSRISKCESDSSWHPTPPTCVPYSCDPPTGLYFAELLDAYKNKTSYPVGSIVKYKCQLGYTKPPEMPFFIKCLESMKWSSVHVLCKKQSCEDPGQPQNGRLIVPKDFLFGSTVNFTCDEGYRLIGQSSIQCVVSGEGVVWSGEIPICQRVHSSLPSGVDEKDSTSAGRRCPVPNVENGRIAGEIDLRLGTQITFICDEGHRVIGHNGARCVLHNNQVVWDHDPPHCQRIPCYPPPNIANGRYEELYDYVYGSAVTYRCDSPFSLIGSSTIVCIYDMNQNGKWSAPAPECRVVTCKTPDVPNGLMRTSYRISYSYQDRILFDCKPGFKLKDNRGDSTCEADSTWQPPLPECVLDRTSSGHSVTSVFGSQAPSLTVPTYTSALPTLQTELAWEKLLAILQEIKDMVNIKTTLCFWLLPPPSPFLPRFCFVTLPAKPQHSGRGGQNSIRVRDTEAGRELRRRSARSLFHLSSPRGLEALRFSFAFGSSLETPPSDAFRAARFPPARAQFGEANSCLDVQFYRRRRSGRSLPRRCWSSGCLARKAWRARVATMLGSLAIRPEAKLLALLSLASVIRGDCGPPPKLKNAVHVTNIEAVSFPTDTVVDYKCLTGFYNIHGKLDVTTCLSNSQWSYIEDFCESTCPAPIASIYARPNPEMELRSFFPPGTTVTYICRQGYDTIPGINPLVTCLQNNTWSEIPVLCKGKSCGNPGKPQNGRAIILTDILYRAKVNFICDEGYRLIGLPFIQCTLKSGIVRWNKDPPDCQPITCSSPPNITGGTHDGGEGIENFAYNSTLTYTCNNGSSLIGEATVHCTTEDKTKGIWKGPVPECQATCKDEKEPPECELGRVFHPHPPPAAPSLPNLAVRRLSPAFAAADSPRAPTASECSTPTLQEREQAAVPPAARPARKWPPPSGDHHGATYTVAPSRAALPHAADLAFCIYAQTTRLLASHSATSGLPSPRWPQPGCRHPGTAAESLTQPREAEPSLPAMTRCPAAHTCHGESRRPEGDPHSDTPRPREPCPPAQSPATTRTLQLARQQRETASPPRPANGKGLTSLQGLLPLLPSGSQSGLRLFRTPVAAMVQRLPACPGAFVASVWLLLLWSEVRGDCGPPRTIPNTRIRQNVQQSSPVGTRITYACIPGYEMTPGTQFTSECLPSSSWSEVSITCQGRRCPIPNIENGRIAGESDLRLGDRITFICDEGHRVIGHNGARCVLYNNQVVWDRDPPLCQRIPCYPPPNIENGRYNELYDYVYGSAVTYRCDSPFSLIGSSTIVCIYDTNQNGKWSAPAPECRVVTCKMPDVPNGLMRTSYRISYSYQDRILFDCKPGFKLKDNRGDSTCEADSTWQPPLPECVLDRTSSEHSVTSVFGSQAPSLTVPTYTSALPTLQTELAWEKLLAILQEIKDMVNIKSKSLEERLDGLEKKVDKVMHELRSCCQQPKERLEEEEEQ
ncbi:complement receptor type 1-like [Paroedura picta]|uniref:complement receptor type 1-like n=1 Tax=Paroedura picta TaxID=143630 RepID=UPI004055E1B4